MKLLPLANRSGGLATQYLVFIKELSTLLIRICTSALGTVWMKNQENVTSEGNYDGEEAMVIEKEVALTMKCRFQWFEPP